MRKNLKFSGHDKFYCRQFWLKKGVHHLQDGKKFNDSAVIDLGVGRNMVTSVKYWVNAFGLAQGEVLSELAYKLLLDGGFDPYIEDIGTVWLLHYYLVTNNYASLYGFVFNEFLVDKIEFTQEMLVNEIEVFCRKLNNKTSIGTLKNDVKTLLDNYSFSEKNAKKGIEAKFSGLLYELSLIKKVKNSGEWLKIERTDRSSLSPYIILFCILNDRMENASIFSFRDLLNKENSVGRVFCLSANGLNDKLQKIEELYPGKITFSDNGGVKVLQVRSELYSWDVLKDYYDN